MRLMLHYGSQENAGGIVSCLLALIEPLPPLDITEFSAELETVIQSGLYGVMAKNAKWWERTTLRMWTGFMALANKYNVPLPSNTVRMIRATLFLPMYSPASRRSRRIRRTTVDATTGRVRFADE